MLSANSHGLAREAVRENLTLSSSAWISTHCEPLAVELRAAGAGKVSDLLKFSTCHIAHVSLSMFVGEVLHVHASYEAPACSAAR